MNIVSLWVWVYPCLSLIITFIVGYLLISLINIHLGLENQFTNIFQILFKSPLYGCGIPFHCSPSLSRDPLINKFCIFSKINKFILTPINAPLRTHARNMVTWPSEVHCARVSETMILIFLEWPREPYIYSVFIGNGLIQNLCTYLVWFCDP